MNVRYYYEFKGYDNILNRVEILTEKTAVSEEIKATDVPFVLQYGDVKKLTPIQGSGATLNLISKSVFQFENLHTDNMQDYLIRFYRDGSLYWMGWLDPELYEENLALYPPYTVEFTAADFNVLERLKFTSETEAQYTDIQPMIIQLKRCFDKLAIPFDKLYIGCTTTAEGVTLSTSESLLHKLYIQSANFYDEENAPMSCKEVIKSILQPFGLMMVQRDASVYIYDYNTVSNGLRMKAYNFDTMTYVADENVPFSLGDMSSIGFMSANAPYGFEDMVNNVSITSSIYALNDYLQYNVTEDNLHELESTTENNQYTLKVYKECPPWDKGEFLLYESSDGSTLMGAKINYTGDGSSINDWTFKNKEGFVISTDGDNFLRLKVDAYVNTRENPFDTEEMENDERTRVIELYCDLVLKDEYGTPLMYYGNIFTKGVGWIPAAGGTVNKNCFVIGFINFQKSNPISDARSANMWITNTSILKLAENSINFAFKWSHIGEGEQIRLPESSGYIELNINYAIISDGGLGESEMKVYPADKVKNILINNMEASFENMAGKPLNTDDYEFKSYINKGVKADFEDVELKCVSANEDKLPIGKGNILYKKDGMYGLQLSFTRSGQTNILERLLLCTIHSNYTRKNRVFTVDLKTTDNPVMRYSTFINRWSGERFITSGCRFDFNRAVTNLTVTNFSEDTDKLSDIPYE